MKDYYKILEVENTASIEDIKKSYRVLAKKYHPDKNSGDVLLENKFKEIAEAYSVIGDESKRKIYDRNNVKIPVGEWGGYDINDILEDLKGTGFTENFNRQFGSGFGYGTKRGGDIHVELNINIDDVYHGCTKTFDYHITSLSRQSTVTVDIPKGVPNGHEIRIKGAGNINNSDLSLPAGDLLVNIRIIPDFDFRIKETGDIYSTVNVHLYTAVLGGEIYIKTVTGNKLKIKIPELSNTGKLLRIKSYGMPVFQGNSSEVQYADMFIELNVVMPDKLSKKERDIFEQLKKNEIDDKSK